MSWQDQARANAAAKAERERLATEAATGNQIALMQAQGAEARANRELSATLVRQTAAEKEKKRGETRDRWKARWAAVGGFARTHLVEVLIYGIAVVSFVMAASAMSRYGADVYASGVGRFLPVITELGMWAFAIAVSWARREDKTRSVWGLQLGVWVFAACAFGTNLIHGLARDVGSGVMMGVVSVAGVIAHQLLVATPPRSRMDRAVDKLIAAESRKRMAAARAAIKAATAVIDADGTARLAYAPGVYEVRRGRLEPVTADPDGPGAWDGVDMELAALLDRLTEPDGHGGGAHAPESGSGGGVATADTPTDRPAADDDAADRPAPRPAPRSARSARPAARPAKTAGRTVGDEHFAALKVRLEEAVIAGDLDPATASPYLIAKTLRCGKTYAKKLRAELDRHPGTPTD